jgi:hypothetical protein
MDENRVIFQFTEWLDEHDLSYEVIKSPKDEPRLCINFPGGWYISISEFDNGLQWYVRDNGAVYWASVFDIVERILKQKAESEHNTKKPRKLTALQEAFLDGDFDVVIKAMNAEKRS